MPCGKQSKETVRAVIVVLAMILLPACTKGPPLPDKNVIVLVVDTFRRDRLGAPGLTPCLDRLAHEGFVFRRAVAASSWTKPSVASILTGLYPSRHGAVGTPLGKIATFPALSSLPEKVTTLAESFKEAGYATAAFVTNPHIIPAFRFDQGFDTFIQPAGDAVELLGRAADWVKQREEGFPFFLYLHLIDPHAPYYPPQAFRERFDKNDFTSEAFFVRSGYPVGVQAWIRQFRDWKQETPGERFHIDYGQVLPTMQDMLKAKGTKASPEEILKLISYDFANKSDPGLTACMEHLTSFYNGEVAYCDFAVERFLAELKSSGLDDDTVMVVTGDHGESFLEHDEWGHGSSVFGEQVDVPLVFYAPGPEGMVTGSCEEPVSLVDIEPTLLEMMGVPAPDGVDGSSLWPVISGTGKMKKEPVFSELIRETGDRVAVVAGSMKVIRILLPGEPVKWSAFDLQNDPLEKNTLPLDQAGPMAQGLSQAIETFIQHRTLDLNAAGAESQLPEEIIKQMRALGYL